ncbi:glycoside hydrolase superfamily [Endogone sp. FLAS-F59071]|nr:glycoside hydrolase superfamily [Endogone sp. FLAS-F59071]|eukprot:RUS18939.1 glycoside hydrolase superfamily [Endogone sp. FLAS-F59071]
MTKCTILIFSAVAWVLGLTGTEAFRVGNGASFIKGINQPWGDGGYGYYLGPDVIIYLELVFLKAFKSLHANFWRLWCFEAGQGLNISNGQVYGISKTFFNSLDNLVAQAGQNHVYVYPTLFSGQPGKGDMNILPNFITDIDAQVQLINNVVKPFAQHYKGNGNIGAIQIYNELNNWCNPYFRSIVGTQQQCKKFVSAVVKAIKNVDPTRLVSVSQILIDDQWHPASSNNKDFMGTGVDFYDIHVYNDNGSLPTAKTFGLHKPVLLGEFGESTSQGTAHQSTTIKNFVSNARKGGWAGALYWTLGEPGQNPQYSNCNDSTILMNLYGCNGQPRPAWYTYRSA